MRVVVVGVFVANQAQMRDRLVVLAAVDRERRGVEPLVDGLRRGFARRRLALADVQVQPDALVQFLLLGILRAAPIRADPVAGG